MREDNEKLSIHDQQTITPSGWENLVKKREEARQALQNEVENGVLVIIAEEPTQKIEEPVIRGNSEPTMREMRYPGKTFEEVSAEQNEKELDEETVCKSLTKEESEKIKEFIKSLHRD
jgi:hypothetical protein